MRSPMSVKRPIIAICIFGILSLVLALASGCGAQGGGTIKVGGLFPYTGALAEFGPDFENGARLAIKHLNDAGVSIELVTGDDGTNPTAAVGAARKLVDTDQVHVIVGPAPSSAAIDVAQTVTLPENIPLVSPSATSPPLTNLPPDQGKDMVFRTAPSDALQGVVLGRLAKEQGYNRAAVVYVDNPYGQGLSENFEKAFAAQGGQVIAKVPHPEAGQPSYVAELRRATESNPDVLVAVSYPQHATVYLKEAVEGNFIKKFLFVDGTKSEEIIQQVGANVVEGMYGTAPGSAESASLNNFNEAYRAQYGEISALPFVANTYDAVIIAGLAAYKAQVDGAELDGPAIRDAMRQVSSPPGENVVAGAEGIKRAVELINQKQDINYEGAATTVNFDQFGDVGSLIEVWQYSGGDLVTVRTEAP
jgi:branched-chain amino acid transport system substrate-binding protein